MFRLYCPEKYYEECEWCTPFRIFQAQKRAPDEFSRREDGALLVVSEDILTRCCSCESRRTPPPNVGCETDLSHLSRGQYVFFRRCMSVLCRGDMK